MQQQRSSAKAIFWRLHRLSMCSPNMGLLAGYRVIHQHHINVIPTLQCTCTSSRAASLDFRSLIQESAWYFFWFRSYKLKVPQCTYTTVYCTCNHHNCMLIKVQANVYLYLCQKLASWMPVTIWNTKYVITSSHH